MLFLHTVIEEDMDEDCSTRAVTLLPNDFIEEFSKKHKLKVKASVEDYASMLYLCGTGFSYSLSEFRGNCGIIIMHNLWCDYSINKIECITMAMDLASEMNYSKVLYSVTENQPVIPALEECGFKEMEGSLVHNNRSGNNIKMYQINI